MMLNCGGLVAGVSESLPVSIYKVILPITTWCHHRRSETKIKYNPPQKAEGLDFLRTKPSSFYYQNVRKLYVTFHTVRRKELSWQAVCGKLCDLFLWWLRSGQIGACMEAALLKCLIYLQNTFTSQDTWSYHPLFAKPMYLHGASTSNCCSATEEIPSYLCNRIVNLNIHKSPSLILILSQ
jgi:hypothetical protein